MTELNDTEKIVRGKAFDTFASTEAVNGGTVGEFRAFSAGFIAGLEYRQTEIDELLKILEQTVADLEFGHPEDNCQMMVDARAAIAKVRGQ